MTKIVVTQQSEQLSRGDSPIQATSSTAPLEDCTTRRKFITLNDIILVNVKFAQSDMLWTNNEVGKWLRLTF